MPWNTPTPIVAGAVAVSSWPNEQVVENWDAIIATIPTTVGALNTQWGSPPPDGAIGRVKVGATPFDFLDLRYDTGLAKWVSEGTWYDMQASTWTVTGQAITTLIVVGGALPLRLLPYKVFADAGLTLEAKCAAHVASEASGATTTNFLYPAVYGSNIGDASLTGSNQTFLTPAFATGLSTTVHVVGSTWGELAAFTATDYVSPFAYIKQDGTGTANFTVASLTIGLRWIG